MSKDLCLQVMPFADGELGEEEAEAFRDHLAECSHCQTELHGLMQLQLLESDLRSQRRRRRRWLGISTAVAAALSLVLVFIVLRGTPQPGAEPPRLALTQTHRSMQVRLSYPGSDRYRPYDALRSGAAASEEEIPTGVLARLEEAGDFHGLAVASLLRGETAQASRYLKKAKSTLATESDGVALEITHRHLESALEKAEKLLEKQPAHPQLLWNRGVALHELGLKLMAAQAFAVVAKLGESGWSAEASARSRALHEEVAQYRRTYAEMMAAASELVQHGRPIPERLVEHYPDSARLFFYDAVRAAPSRQRILDLEALAQYLDHYHGGSQLQDYLRQIAGADFALRGPLAMNYAELIARSEHFDDGARSAFFARLRSAKQWDILLGALVQTEQVPQHLDEYMRLIEASSDPWLRLLGVQQQAQAFLTTHNDVERAQQVLLQATQECRSTRFAYRCAYLEFRISELLNDRLHQSADATLHARRGWSLARAAGEWNMERSLLARLGQNAYFSDAPALARAYLGESTQRDPQDCAISRLANQIEAELLRSESRIAEAQAALRKARVCPGALSFLEVFAEADLWHFQGTSAESTPIRDKVHLLRQEPSLGPAREALLDHIEGRLLLWSDPAQGELLLRRAITKAAQAPSWDADAQKARAYSFTLLSLRAAQAHAFQHALSLLGEEAQLSSSTLPCLLAITREDERLAIIASDANGHIFGTYDGSRSERTLSAETLVPEEFKTALRGCVAVRVLDRYPMSGHPRLLPPDMAWSYHIGRPQGVPNSPPTDAQQDLLISEVAAPPALGLPLLSAGPPPHYAHDSQPEPKHLRGTAATPARVLEEMRVSKDIEIHAHGLRLPGVADAPVIVLAEDPNQHYLLTDVLIRKNPLAGQPLVLLAACEAALVVEYMHKPLSLPRAFIDAGARAVVASAVPIPDAEARQFFAELRARVRSRQPLAQALRELRLKNLAQNPQSWVRDVVLFDRGE